MARMTKAQVQALVDEIGDAKAAMAPLEAAHDALVAKLKTLGDGKYFGERFDASVFTTLPNLFDKEKAATFMTDRQFNACIYSGNVKVTAKVTAKKTKVAPQKIAA